MTISVLPELDPGAPTRPRRRAVRLVAAVMALAVLTVGIVAANTSGADDPRYRTATAGVHDVDAVVDTVATIEPVSQAAVGFPVAGTVATVLVSVGGTVEVGQTLATLDAESLEQTVRTRQAALDQANLALASALAGEPVTGTGAGAGAGDSGTAASEMTPTATDTSTAVAVWAVSTGDATGAADTVATAAATPTAAAVDDDQVRAAQQAVVDAQRQVDVALLAADAALATADQVCATTAVDTDDASGSTTTAAPDDASDACLTALTAVQSAQQQVAAAQQSLSTAADTLGALLDERAASTPSAGSDGALTAPSTGSAPTGGSGGLTGGSAAGSDTLGGSTAEQATATAEQLIALQRSVSSAELQLAVAMQAVAQATIVSPIAGTVVADTLDVGQDVTAGSSTDAITIEGDGGFEATTTLDVDQVGDIELGQTATLRPDGSDVVIDAEVVAIDLVGDGSDGTYRVTAALTGDTAGTTLRNGATGSLAIVTGATTQALAVPTSAVSTADGTSTVRVVDDTGAADEVTVRVGVVGSEWTEILDGVDDGSTVVLAELDEPLPGSATDTSDTSTDSSRFPGGMTFPGGGRGGFPTGGPPSGAVPGG